MSNKGFGIVVGFMLAAVIALVVFTNNNKQEEALIGTQHESQGGQHIQRGQDHEPYNSDLPSSGPHYADQLAPTPWGIYTQEVPAEVFIHNLEHGGIVVAHLPNLPDEQLQKLRGLFTPPYSNPNFSPVRAIVTPRSANTKPIQLAAWTYTLDLDEYDEATIIKFYEQHVGKGPEPGAGPFNEPINQAAVQIEDIP